MKLRTVWGILPAIVYDRALPKGMGGQTFGCIVQMSKYTPSGYDVILAHELVHVKQNYAIAGVIILSGILSVYISPLFIIGALAVGLWRLTKRATFIMECAAYGETVRRFVAGGMSLESALSSTARALDTLPFYSEKASYAEIKNQIKKRYEDKRIF